MTGEGAGMTGAGISFLGNVAYGPYWTFGCIESVFPKLTLIAISVISFE